MMDNAEETVLNEGLMETLMGNAWSFATEVREYNGEIDTRCWYELSVPDPATKGTIFFHLRRGGGYWVLEVGTALEDGRSKGLLCKMALPQEEFNAADQGALWHLLQHVKRSAMDGLSVALFGEEE